MLRKRLVIGLLAACMLFGGCGKGNIQEEVTDEVNTESSESIDYVALYQSLPTNELFKEEWKRNDLTNAEHFMSFTDYLPEIIPQNEDGDRFNRGFCADTENIYSLDTYYHFEGDKYAGTANYLNKIDGITREVSTIAYEGLILEGIVAAGGRLFSQSMDMDESGMTDELFCVELLQDGTFAKLTDVCKIATQNHFMPTEPRLAPEVKLYYEPASELSFLISPDETRMLVIDKDGNNLPELEEGGERAKIQLLVATAEGKLIFLKSEANQTTIFYYEGGEKKILFTGPDGPERGEGILTADNHGKILFPNKGKTVISWDTATGTQERLYIESSMDEHSSIHIDCMMRNKDGELLILMNNALRVVTEKGPAKQVTISIKPMLYYDEYYFQRCLKRYELSHPGIRFDLQETSEWENRDRDTIQLIQEISDGGGADLLLLDRNVMLDFDKNDCLMDISDLLPDSTKEKLIDGVMDYGRTERGIKLLSYAPSLETLFVNRKYLHNSSWTMQDLIAIIEEREAQGNPFEQLVAGSLYDPFLLISNSVNDSDFIDLKAGTCDFENDIFIKMLEICKRYPVPASVQEHSEIYKLMKEDKLLIYSPMFVNIEQYSESCAALGEDFVTAGFPSASGNGNHMNFYMGFAVNKNSENYEVIADFVNWMFALECPENIMNVPTRTDIFEGRIIMPSRFSYIETPAIRCDSHSVVPIDAKPDGSTYVDEYLQLLKSSRYDARYYDTGEIVKILWEEADAFFNGNKSAKEVAAVIQSRVSLYLMENN